MKRASANVPDTLTFLNLGSPVPGSALCVPKMKMPALALAPWIVISLSGESIAPPNQKWLPLETYVPPSKNGPSKWMSPAFVCTTVPAFVTAPLNLMGWSGVTFTVASAPIVSGPFTVDVPLMPVTPTVAPASTESGIVSGNTASRRRRLLPFESFTPFATVPVSAPSRCIPPVRLMPSTLTAELAMKNTSSAVDPVFATVRVWGPVIEASG